MSRWKSVRQAGRSKFDGTNEEDAIELKSAFLYAQSMHGHGLKFKATSCRLATNFPRCHPINLKGTTGSEIKTCIKSYEIASRERDRDGKDMYLAISDFGRPERKLGDHSGKPRESCQDKLVHSTTDI